MPISEFDLIARYFARQDVRRPDVPLGVGDDCALLRAPAGMDLAVTTDTLVAGVHFPENTHPEALGHKALAVNLSDLAAMGAEPAWAMLALTLPQADEAWLEAFARGLLGLAARYGVQLVGGDTTRGPLSVTLQVFGFVPQGKALRRDAAQPGDLICVTGTLGDAGLGLRIAQGKLAAPAPYAEYLLGRLERPVPRVETGLALRGLAHAAIDVSDGLVADLGHILDSSGVGATVQVERIPVSAAFRELVADDWNTALGSGDDYELCFTLPPERRAELEKSCAERGECCTCIGVIEQRPGLRLLRNDGSAFDLAAQGYDHFRG